MEDINKCELSIPRELSIPINFWFTKPTELAIPWSAFGVSYDFFEKNLQHLDKLIDLPENSKEGRLISIACINNIMPVDVPVAVINIIADYITFWYPTFIENCWGISSVTYDYQFIDIAKMINEFSQSERLDMKNMVSELINIYIDRNEIKLLINEKELIEFESFTNLQQD